MKKYSKVYIPLSKRQKENFKNHIEEEFLQNYKHHTGHAIKLFKTYKVADIERAITLIEDVLEHDISRGEWEFNLYEHLKKQKVPPFPIEDDKKYDNKKKEFAKVIVAITWSNYYNYIKNIYPKNKSFLILLWS